MPDIFSPTRTYPSSELVRYDLGWHTPPWLPESIEEMHRQSQWFLNDLAHRKTGQVSPRWLTLCGHSGCGKSHLARAIRVIARSHLGFEQHTAQMHNVAIYAKRIREGEHDFHEHLARLPLLVLDDLGAEYSSEFLRSSLYDLLDRRLNKWTVITSNLSVADIADRIDVRIASRLKRGHSVIVESRDPFDFCHEARKQNYTPNINTENPKHENIIANNTPHIPHPQALATEQEQSEIRAELRALIAETRAMVPHTRFRNPITNHQ